jgi:cysteine synthase
VRFVQVHDFVGKEAGMDTQVIFVQQSRDDGPVQHTQATWIVAPSSTNLAVCLAIIAADSGSGGTVMLKSRSSCSTTTSTSLT